MSDDKRVPDEREEASEEEISRAADLARSLEKQGQNDLADFAESLRAAHAPNEIQKDAHEKIIAKVLAKEPATPARGRVIRVAFGVSAVLAVAAALLVFLTKPKMPPTPEDAPLASLVRSRSTSPLFKEPFRNHDATARIDRIASSREHDYRENMFALATRPTRAGSAR